MEVDDTPRTCPAIRVREREAYEDAEGEDDESVQDHQEARSSELAFSRWRSVAYQGLVVGFEGHE